MGRSKNTAVCVIIPWGKESNIQRCIRSTLQQSFSRIEMLVIANGSVSQDIYEIQRNQFSDSRLRFIYLPGCMNANIARNMGMAYAKTKYVAFLDSDDWWDETHIEESLDRLVGCEADLVYSGMRIHSDDKVIERAAVDYKPVGSMENYCLSYLPAPTGSLVCHREAALDIMWDNSLHRHQDYDFKGRFARKYRIAHKSSISVNVDWTAPTRHRHYDDCFRLLESWRHVVDPMLYRRHYINLFNGAVRNRDFIWILKTPMFFGRKILIARNRVIKLFGKNDI